MRVTDIVLQWEDTREIQVGIETGNDSDGYRLTVGGYWGIQVGIVIGNESDGYCLRVGGYSVMHIGTDIANQVTAVV